MLYKLFDRRKQMRVVKIEKGAGTYVTGKKKLCLFGAVCIHDHEVWKY